MATNEAHAKTLRVAPQTAPGPLKGPGDASAAGRPGWQPGAGRAAAPLLAYVLHRHDWSESSLIVELFTRAQGRLVVVAKGAKKPTSNFRAVLLPFSPLHALMGKASADPQVDILALRSAEWVGGAPLLAADSMWPGFYLNELLLKLLARQDPHPVLFDAYADTLAALAARTDEAAALRAFELKLLRELGWLPELDSATLTAQPLLPAGTYTLHPEAGVTAHPQGVPGAVWVALEAALSHAAASGGTAALRAVCGPVAGALRTPLRAVLHYHLGHTRLRTRDVWQGVQRLAETR